MAESFLWCGVKTFESSFNLKFMCVMSVAADLESSNGALINHVVYRYYIMGYNAPLGLYLSNRAVLYSKHLHNPNDFFCL